MEAEDIAYSAERVIYLHQLFSPNQTLYATKFLANQKCQLKKGVRFVKERPICALVDHTGDLVNLANSNKRMIIYNKFMSYTLIQALLTVKLKK